MIINFTENNDVAKYNLAYHYKYVFHLIMRDVFSCIVDTNVNVTWKCKVYGELFRASVKGMVIGCEKCPYCSGKKAVQGVTSLKA